MCTEGPCPPKVKADQCQLEEVRGCPHQAAWFVAGRPTPRARAEASIFAKAGAAEGANHVPTCDLPKADPDPPPDSHSASNYQFG